MSTFLENYSSRKEYLIEFHKCQGPSQLDNGIPNFDFSKYCCPREDFQPDTVIAEHTSNHAPPQIKGYLHFIS